MKIQQQSNTITSEIIDICAEFSIVALYLFGSQAKTIWKRIEQGQRLQSEEGHDLDVGVKLEANHKLSVWEKVTLAQKLENLFNVSRIDLVNLAEADPFLAANIIRGERLYAADRHAADEYELFILRQAGDLAPFERLRQQMILEGSTQ